MISSKLFKTPDVIYLNGLKNWDTIKRNSKSANKLFFDSEHQRPVSRDLGFNFIAKNISNLFKVYFTLLDDKGSYVEFRKGEDKVPVLNFKFK